MATTESANGSHNETSTNSKLKFDDNILPLPPRVARRKNNIVVAITNYGAINSLK